MEASNLRILLTGASSGIGWHLARQLARKNNRILAVSRNIANIPACPGVIFPFSADFSQPSEILRTFRYLKENWGGIDLCIANAGFAYREILDQIPLDKPEAWEHIQKIYNLNTLGQIYAVRLFCDPVLNPNPEGREKMFVSTLSAVAMIPLPYYALYCSTKSGLDGFWKTYRYEKAPWLRLMRVYPVATRTKFFQRASQEENPPLPLLTQSAESVAKSILRGIRHGRSKVYPSKIFALAYPLMRAFPCLSQLYSFNEKQKMQRHFKKTMKR